MNKILRFLICATLLSVGVLIHILCMGKDAEQLSFVPPEFDASAQVGMPVIPEVLSGGTAELGNYKMTLTGVIPLKSKDAYIYFANHANNDVWMKVRLLDSNGTVIGESGLLKPNEYVEKIRLKQVPKESEIVVKVMCYEPDTYHSKGSAQLPLPTIEIP